MDVWDVGEGVRGERIRGTTSRQHSMTDWPGGEELRITDDWHLILIS